VRLYSGASARHVRPPVGVLLVVGIGGPVRLYPGASARHVRPPGGEGKFTRRWDWCPGASLFGGFGSPRKTTGGNWRSAFVVFFFLNEASTAAGISGWRFDDVHFECDGLCW